MTIIIIFFFYIVDFINYVFDYNALEFNLRTLPEQNITRLILEESSKGKILSCFSCKYGCTFSWKFLHWLLLILHVSLLTIGRILSPRPPSKMTRKKYVPGPISSVDDLQALKSSNIDIVGLRVYIKGMN